MILIKGQAHKHGLLRVSLHVRYLITHDSQKVKHKTYDKKYKIMLIKIIICEEAFCIKLRVGVNRHYGDLCSLCRGKEDEEKTDPNIQLSQRRNESGQNPRVKPLKRDGKLPRKSAVIGCEACAVKISELK